MKKSILTLFFIFLLVFSTAFAPSASAVSAKLTGVEVRAEGVLLASLDTDEVIYSKNASKKMYPASLTKIMTALVVLKNTKDIDKETIVMPAEALRLISGTGSTVTGFLEGEEVTVRDALAGLLITSGGDVSYALALHYGGTVDGFVEMMNREAEALGMKDTHFANPHGLHDDDHYTTANDLLLVSKAALEYPEFVKLVGASRYKMPATNLYKARTLVTTNFLQDSSTAYYYKYASGIKTGYTDEAGRCLITTAEKNGYTYLLILLKSPPKNASGQSVRYEFTDSKNIYEWAFTNLEYKTAMNAGTVACEIPVKHSMQADFVALAAEKELASILPKGADDSTVSLKTLPFNDEAVAPIKKGDVLGVAEVYYADELIGTVNLVATEDVSSSVILKVLSAIGSFFTSTFFKAVLIIILMIIVIFFMYVVYLNRNRKRKKRRVVYKPDRPNRPRR